MGKGIGPIAEAEVVSAVWIILSQDKSSILLSNALSLILIFCCAIDAVPLPTKRKIYCVLRSPHVDKDSREHFETRTHRRIIDIYSPSANTIDALMTLDLPSGVDIEVKL